MSVLGQDAFARTGASLGSQWVEHAATDMSTDLAVQNGVALLDTHTVFHRATMVGTLNSNQYVQCWVRCPNASNNAGIMLRFQDASNFYYSIIVPGAGLYLVRYKAAVATILVGPIPVATASNTWYRVSGQIVGTLITLYVDNLYNTNFTREGPQIYHDDTVDPITGAGLAGIVSSGNNATGASGPMWNDFICFNGQPQAIYVDPSYNGGLAGEGMGTEDRPDIGIAFGLNNAGLVCKGTLRIANAGPIGNGGANQYRLGHEGKFTGSFSFPTYSDDNGLVTNPGSPNLIVEAADGYRPELTETRNAPYFNLRSDATGILFRGLYFDLQGGVASSAVRNGSPAGDRSYCVDKCLLSNNSLGQDQALYVEDCTEFRARYNWFGAPQSGKRFIGLLGEPTTAEVRMNVFDGRGKSMECAIYQHSTVAVGVGSYWDLDHNHYVGIARPGGLAAYAIHLNNPAGIAGTVEVQNGLFYGGSDTDPAERTDYGIYANGAGALGGGTVNAHHNSYNGVATPRDTAITDGGNEIDGAPDPNFPNEIFYTWLHTEQVGGATAIQVIGAPGNLEPRAVGYINNADDSTLLQGILDRGALQGYAIPVQRFAADLFCTVVVYDPGGRNETLLGARLLSMRPIRQEKDVELRSYRASDTELVFVDHDNFFQEGRAGSFLADPDTGEPNWYNKVVEIHVYFGGPEPHRYIGYVLGITRSRGQATIRLGNRFQFLFSRKVRATSQGRTAKNGTVELVANYPITVNRPVCKVETWTFRFVGPTDYELEGSETGFDGTGTLGSAFTSNSGSISVFNWPAAPLNVGDVVEITTEWLGDAGTFIDDLYKRFMLDAEGAGLTAADLDPAIDDLYGTQFDPTVVAYVIDTPTTVLDAIDEISRHIGAVTIEKANATIGLNLHMPRIATVTPAVLCKGRDLMAASTDHLDIINEFRAEWAYDREELRFLGGTKYPRTEDDNESLVKYGRLLPAPRILQFRGFDASQQSWVEHLLAVLYLRYKDPRRQMSLLTTSVRMDAELDTIYSVDSEAPDFFEEAVELYVLKKDLGNVTVTMEAIDATPFIQVPGACGWLSYDTPGEGYDQCWGYL